MRDKINQEDSNGSMRVVISGAVDAQAISAKAAGGWRHEIRAMLALALPLIIGNLAQNAINTTDVLVLGRYHVDALAASALAVNLYFLFGVMSMGVLTAASPLIAAARGRKIHSIREIRRTVRQGLWLAFALCLPAWLILWQTESILHLLGQPEKLSIMAGEYVRIAMWGLFPFLVQIVLRYYVSALERPIWGVIVTAIGVLVNLVVDIILVFGLLGFPEMGLAGAAIASVIANITLMLGMIWVVTGLNPFRRYHLFGRFWVSDWPRFIEIFRVGVPIGVIFAFEVAIFSAAAFLMGLISESQLAAHAIALQIASLFFMIPLSIGQASTVRVGVHYGRQNNLGISQAGWSAFILGFVAAGLSSLAMILVPQFFVGLFVDPSNSSEDRAVFDIAISFVFVAAIFQLVDAAQAIGAGVLRGLQDTRWPMLFAAFGYWVIGIGTAWYLAFEAGWQGVGVWIGLASGLGAVAILMMARWLLRNLLDII